MPSVTPAKLLADAIGNDRKPGKKLKSVDAALGAVYASERSPPDLEAFEIVMGREPQQLAKRMLEMIKDEKLYDKFLTALRRFGINLEPVAASTMADLVDGEQSLEGLGKFAIDAVPAAVFSSEDHFDSRDFAQFLDRARDFRCLVRVDGQVNGSGALISPRLILTAYHVITSKDEKKIPSGRKIEIRDSAGRWHLARIDYGSPCHAGEWAGIPPDGPDAEKHHDVVVLRIAEPIGHFLGHVDLPAPHPGWGDGRKFVLVHYPAGEERGVGVNVIDPNPDGDAVRVRHGMNTTGGSSGGACFDLQGQFIGFHQGRIFQPQKQDGEEQESEEKLKKHMVPYNRFAADPKFREALDGDRDPPRLWSLDNSLQSDFILGRKDLFAATGAMKGDRHDNIRGLWVQRTAGTKSDAGLSFTYEILERYLDPANHRLIRISADVSTQDFIELVAAASRKPGEMAQVGRDDDQRDDLSRIRSLSEWLNATAIRDEQKYWLFIDNPVSGLIARHQQQLGQFVSNVLRHSQLRTVLTGCETYTLDIDTFSTLDMADKASAPGFFREFVGRFNRNDVRETLQLIGNDVGMRWSPERRDEAAYRALHNIKPAIGNHYAMTDVGKVVGQISEEVELRCRFEATGFG